MLFLHRDIELIEDYIASHRLRMAISDLLGTSSKPATMEEVRQYFRETYEYQGEPAKAYILVAQHDNSDVALPLRQAAKEVEMQGGQEVFLLVGYEDGGVISISAALLPFQAHAPSAEWWRIDDRGWPPMP
jgi:hypothetical protein